MACFGEKIWLGFQNKRQRKGNYLTFSTNWIFKVAMVFVQKATDKVLISNISSEIKDELMKSKVYPEGRVIRLIVHNDLYINDIKKLVEVKIAF